MTGSQDMAGANNSVHADAAHVRGVRLVTWVSMAVNFFLIVLKAFAGFAGNSKTLVADAVHSAADFLTGIALLVGVRYWSASADEQHPHGHRRIEAIVAAFIGATLAAVALGICRDAIATWPERHSAPRWIAFAAALISIITKEWLYRWSIVVADRIRSDAVRAHALEHRSDALSSVPAAAAVFLAIVLGSKWSFIDHIGAIAVSMFILYYAWKIIRPAAAQLVDTGASAAVCRKIEETALGTPGVKFVHAVRTRYSGPALHVDLHVKVDGALSVREGHNISEAVKSGLMKDNPDIVDVVVHIEPFVERPETPPANRPPG